MRSFVQTLNNNLSEASDYIPPGLVIFTSTAFLEGGKYLKAYQHEFFGTLLMIVCTFSAGKWIGSDSVSVAWITHAAGVIAADYFAGGPHVNPAVTMSMWCLGKCSYTEAYIRVAAQLAGGLVSFPLFHALADSFKLVPFGGPEFTMDEDNVTEAFLSEFFATILLMFAIYILNWEINFGKFHYIIKQGLTAAAIRALIEGFPTAGPAMNPMLGTAWDVFGVGTTYEYPSEFAHYFVYWVAPCLAAIVASVCYVIYAGGTIFGKRLPIGPFKKTTAPKISVGKKKK